MAQRICVDPSRYIRWGTFQGGLGVFVVAVCPRCRQEVSTLLRPRYDVTLCSACWDLLLTIAAGDVDDVDAR